MPGATVTSIRNSTTEAAAEPSSQSGAIAAWAARLRFADAPAPVQRQLRSCLLYNLGMALAVDPHADDLGAVLLASADAAGNVPLINGRGTRSARDAAFVNAALITARGQNDTYADVLTHAGCVLIPAALALARQRQTPVDRLLDALLVGYELIPRLAEGLSEKTAARGFRSTPIFGVVGVAVACARLLDLSPEQTANAISIATNLAAGTMQTWAEGSDEWRLQIARTSQGGVLASQLASQGLRGAMYSLEGRSGFAQAYAGGPFELDLSGWRLDGITFKPYPGCAVNQAPVSCLIALLRQHGIDGADVAGLRLDMSPSDASYPGVDALGPFSSAGGAIMSAQFMLAATLRDGQPGVAHFEREFSDGPLHAFSRRIVIRSSSELARGRCRITVETHGGASHTRTFEDEHPFVFTWAETESLVRRIADEWPDQTSAERVGMLVAAVRKLGDGGSLQDLESALYRAPVPRAPHAPAHALAGQAKAIAAGA